jgi:hypothetical protein
MPASTATSDEQTNRLETDNDPGPDVSLLKEIGRKALIDSLNTVRLQRAECNSVLNIRR